MKKFALVLILVSTFILNMACDNNNQNGFNFTPSENPELFSISISQLDSAQHRSFMMIPLEIFGGTLEDLTGATISVYVNGSLFSSGIDAEPLYKASTNHVHFFISPISANNVIGFAIRTNVGAILLYEGTVSASASTEAPLVTSLTRNGIPNNDGDMATFFEQMQNIESDGLIGVYSQMFTVDFGTLIFSNACELDFMQNTGFYFSNSGFYTNAAANASDLATIIDLGAAGFETDVDLNINNGDLNWGSQSNNHPDLNGIINNDGSFTLFKGTYLDEGNYTYQLIQGQIVSDQFSGTFTHVIELDGTRVQNLAIGSCTASAAVSGMMLGSL